MSRPLIGISAYRRQTGTPGAYVFALRPPYTEIVHQAGGLAIIIPLGQPDDLLRELYDHLDGIILSGGGDVHPGEFGQQLTSEVSEVDADRDRIELNLTRWALADGKPFLGICRGVQVMNVAMGGSLLLDIPTARPDSLQHTYYPDYPWDKIAHPVEVIPDSHLGRALGDTRVEVNSLHHQSCDRIGDGLRVVAHAPDGIIEGIETTDSAHPFGIGVQWHPEWLGARPETRRLLSTFVAAARNGH